MGKKIFISYKYGDTDVYSVSNNATVRNYVNYLEDIIGKDNIYKGEHDNEDLSEFTDPTIWSHLKEKIFDSSITIILISKNMRERFTSEKSQWIPQEISYSLKEISNNNGQRKSLSNGLIYVVLPDKSNSYNYFINQYIYNINIIFTIMTKNLNNKKFGNGNYAVIVKWNEFIQNIDKYIKEASEHQSNIDDYKICKEI